MRLYKRNSMWYGDHSVRGIRKRWALSTDKRVAEQILHSEIVNADRYNAGLPVDIPIQRLFDEYLRHLKATRREKTYEKEAVNIKHLQGIIDSKMRISGVTNNIVKIIDDYKIRALSEGRNPFTVNGILATARAVLNKAVKWNYLRTNPLAKIERIRVPRIPRPRFLTDFELEQVYNVCRDELKEIITILVFTGMRAAELMFLEWQDVDFVNNVIRLRQKDIFIPKSHESREIPINPQFRQILFDMKKKSHSSFIVGNSTGDRKKDAIYRQPSKGREYRSIYRKFKRAVKRSGISNTKKVCIHTLRHTFGSHSIMKSVNIVALSKIMGHADLSTTMIYTHVSPDFLKEEMAKLQFDFIDSTSKECSLEAGLKHPAEPPNIDRVLVPAMPLFHGKKHPS